YREYFLKLFEAQFPDHQERLARLAEAGQWCLETYWKDGRRKLLYEGTPLQQQLLSAGILVAADARTAPNAPPHEVQFFHDSMQSYLTAHGLASQDQKGYAELPRPVDDPTTQTWDRSRVLLWAAANPKFAGAWTDSFRTGGTELFKMCLATFPEGLRQFL